MQDTDEINHHVLTGAQLFKLAGLHGIGFNNFDVRQDTQCSESLRTATWYSHLVTAIGKGDRQMAANKTAAAGQKYSINANHRSFPLIKSQASLPAFSFLGL